MWPVRQQESAPNIYRQEVNRVHGTIPERSCLSALVQWPLAQFLPLPETNRHNKKVFCYLRPPECRDRERKAISVCQSRCNDTDDNDSVDWFGFVPETLPKLRALVTFLRTIFLHNPVFQTWKAPTQTSICDTVTSQYVGASLKSF